MEPLMLRLKHDLQIAEIIVGRVFVNVVNDHPVRDNPVCLRPYVSVEIPSRPIVEVS
jgi:hypothetical protein